MFSPFPYLGLCFPEKGGMHHSTLSFRLGPHCEIRGGRKNLTSRYLKRAAALLLSLLCMGVLSLSSSAAEALLNWNDNSNNEAGFNVERSVEGGSWEQIGTTGVDEASYSDVTVEAGVNYTYRVNAYNDFGVSGYTNVASYYKNVLPEIGAIANQAVEENGTSAAIVFSVSDFETAAAELVVSAASSNSSILTADGISLGGSGSSRTITLTPEYGASGSAVVTVTVDDGTDSVSTQFTLAVSAYVAPAIDLQLSYIGSGARSGEPFEVSITSSDLSQFSSVSYLLDGQSVGTSSTAPFTTSVTAAEGSYTLQAVASAAGYDATSSDSTTLIVGQAPTDGSLVDGMREVSTDQSSENGSVSYDLASDSFTMTDDVGVIDGDKDSHRYYYALVSGDVDIRVRLASLSASSGQTVGGLMLRSALYGRSEQVSLLSKSDGAIESRERTTRGGATATESLAGSGSGLGYLRIARSGSSVTLYGSSNGSSWTTLATKTVSLGDPYFVGLALAAGTTGGEATAIFDKLSIAGAIQEWPADAAAPAIPTGLLITDVN